jgi:BolA family transcriptional regulator, general stress-responsive regulator
LPRAQELQEALQKALSPTYLQVIDESAAHAGHAGAQVAGVEPGYGTHFRVRVASHSFTGMSRVAQHRLVYDALQRFVERGMHALAIEIVPASSSATTSQTHPSI